MSKVKFTEDDHKYYSEENNELISVSLFTDGFKEKVDWNAIAKKVAAKMTREGIPATMKDVLEKWARKRDAASSVGTLYHAIRERELMEEKLSVFYGSECKTKSCPVTGLEKWSLPINELENNTVYPELMIYDFEHMICGQADKVIVADNKINIWDYKTDAEIKFKAYSSQWVKSKKMLPPISHLDDCNGVHYSLKMSLYMYLLWKANGGRFKPGEIIIEHVHLKRDPENDNIPVLEDGKPVVIKEETIVLPYRKKEVMDMLNYVKIKA